MDIEILGIDLGKTVRSLAGLDVTGALVYRNRLQRLRLLGLLEGLRPCFVAMEACGVTHHIGGFCLQQSHKPRLMSPLYVRPYVKVHNDEDRDAKAIAEGATRVTMPTINSTAPVCSSPAPMIRIAKISTRIEPSTDSHRLQCIYLSSNTWEHRRSGTSELPNLNAEAGSAKSTI